MKQGIAIALISAVAIFLFAYLCLGSFGYKKKNEARYSFLSMFPYEMVGESHRAFWMPIYVAIGLFVLSMVGSTVLIQLYEWPSASLRLLGAAVGLIYLISLSLMVVLMVLPAKFIKSHIKVASSFIATSGLSSIMSGFALIKVSAMQEIAPMTIGFVLLFLGVLIFAFMLHPGFANWAKLDAQIGEDGSMSVIRPKRFILAYAEWIAIISLVISIILILIGLMLTK